MSECKAISDSWDGRQCGCPECRSIADVLGEVADEQEDR